jgi:hypothetical protein
MSGDEFNVRDLIREVAADVDGFDASVIAGKVAPLVPESVLREVLALALRPLVREVLQENRPRGQIGQVGSRPVPVPVLQARPVTAAQLVQPAPSPSPAVFSRVPGPVPALPAALPAPTPVHRVQTVGGRKGSEIRDAWQRVLEAPYATEHGRKKLGDFTYEDCLFQSNLLAKQLDDLGERRRGWNGLGALLLDHDARTIRDLPAEVKMQALGAKA